MSDSRVVVSEDNRYWPARYRVMFDNLGGAEIQAIQTALIEYGKSQRALFNNGATNAVGESAEGLADKLWEARNV